MKIEYNRLFLTDCLTVTSIMLVLWTILTFVMIKVAPITPTHVIKSIILIAGAAAGTFATASSIAVLLHLRRNREELYLEELSNRKSEK